MAIDTPNGGGGGDDDVRFEELWASRDALQSLCRRLVGDHALAEDMVQEAYLEAFRRIDTIERRDTFMPWLATVAKRRGLNELRRGRYSVPTDAPPECGSTPEWDPSEVAASRDEIERVRSALSALTPRERTLLARQLASGLSIAELAAEEHSTPASVRSVLARARSKLRSVTGGDDFWALGPIFALGRWMRRRGDEVAVRAQHAGTAAVQSYEGLTQAAAAVAVMAASIAAPAAAAPPAAPVENVAMAAPVGYDFELPRYQPTEASAPVEAAEAPEPTVATPAPAPSTTADETEPSPEGDDDGPGRSDPAGPVFDDAGWQHSPTEGTPEPRPDQPVPPVRQEKPEQPDEVAILGFATPSGSGSSNLVFAYGRRPPPCEDGCTALFRSDDGGASWIPLAAEGLGDAKRVVASPDVGVDGRLFGVTDTGLVQSRDGGESFEFVAAVPGVTSAAVSPEFGRDPRVVMASSTPVVFDAAASSTRPWKGAPPAGVGTRLDFHPSDGSVVYAGGFGPGPEGTKVAAVYRCIEESCTERTPLVGLGALPEVFVPSTHAVDRTVHAFQGSVLFVSTDAGKTFEHVELPIAGSIAGMTDDGAGTVFVAVHGYSETGPVGGLLTLRFGDAGLEWDEIGGEVLAEGVKAVGYVDGRVLAAQPEGGVWCTESLGHTWSTRCTGG